MKRPAVVNIFATIVLLLACAFNSAARQYYFTHYDITNGLSQNTVHKIIQDRQGFMWFATKDGLNRFDGTRFRRIGLDTTDGDCSFISTIFEDSEGKIWVGTHLGPCLYDPETERLVFLTIKSDNGKSLHSTISDFAESPDGAILMAVDNIGVFSYDKERNEFASLLSISESGISSITRIEYSPSGAIYLGTFGNGLYYTDNYFTTIESVTGNDGKPYFDKSVVNSVSIQGDKVYVATDNMGLHCIDSESGTITPVFITDEKGNVPYMRDVNFNGGSEIFVGTEVGLYIYNIAENRLEKHLVHDYYDRFSISDDAIYSVFTDRDGGLWVGSYFGGIDYLGVYQPEFIRYFKNTTPGSIPSERIRELYHDSSGIVYVGSEDSGLSAFNPATREFSRLEGITEKNIHGLCVDGDELWVGTFSEGLIIKNLKTGSIRRLKSGGTHGLASDFIFSIRRTRHGDIYLGTFSGLQRYDRQSNTFRKISELDGLFIYNIFEDSHGNLWIGTYSDGLFMREAGKAEWNRYLEDSSDTGAIPSNKVYSVQEDSRHNIWVMTQNGPCVYTTKDRTFSRNFLGIDKIPGVAYRMEEDDAGKYWITSNHGLYCIDAAGGTMWNFTTQDGLPTNQFNYNSSLKTPDGKLFFGSINGLVSFDPMRFVPAAASEASLTVTEMYINASLVKPGEENSPLSKSITMTDEIVLKPWQNSITLNLTGFAYGNSRRQKIKYRLRGFDEQWEMLQPGHGLINYSNLPSGKYHLQAALCSDDGSETGPMLDVFITIETPWHRTWWAITIYILLSAALLAAAYIYYRRYTRLSNQRYIENYKHEKEIELFDSKIKFFTNLAHEIRTPLTLIKATLDSTIKGRNSGENRETRENLNAINLNVDRLLNLADELLDFRKIESGDYSLHKRECNINKLIEHLLALFRSTIEASGKEIELSLPADDVIAYVDADAISKIVSNMLSNAAKYGESYVKISLTGNYDSFVLRVANDGAVVKPQDRENIFKLFTRLDDELPGTGVGLSFARSLATMHGGSLTMGESESENIFTLEIPLGESTESTENDVTETDLEKMVKVSGDSSNVLLVENHPELLTFLQKKLTDYNYRVFTATDGDEALAILGEQHIDLVITEVMMPKMSGYDLVKSIKDNTRLQHIPVIILTAKTRVEDKIAGLQAGADAYIEKPFSLEYLLVSIESLLRNRERMRTTLDSAHLGGKLAKDLSKDDEEFLVKVDSAIRHNFDNPDFSVDDLIGMLGISNTTFYRKIKRLLDLNPNEYIKLQRLKRAAELFRNGYTSVSEVGYMVGFSSPGYFTKCFQKQFGVSPKEYISSIKNS